MTEYNGHPSWEHWNVSLWIYNDEGIYRHAQTVCRGCINIENAAQRLTRDLHDFYPGGKTPDGAPWEQDLVEYALEDIWAETNESA